MALDTAIVQARPIKECQAQWKIAWDNNCECHRRPTCHPGWRKEARLGPEYHGSHQIGPLEWKVRMDLCADKPASSGDCGWSTIFAGHRPGNPGVRAFRIEPANARTTAVTIDVYDRLDGDHAPASELIDWTFPIAGEALAFSHRVQEAHNSGVRECGALVTGIDSERQTQRWSTLAYEIVAGEGYE